MPTVTVEMLVGRSDSQKSNLEAALIQAITRTLGVEAKSVRIKLIDREPTSRSSSED